MSGKILDRINREKPGIVFLHIPKTGGTSISKAFRRHYPFSQFHVKSGASAKAALADIDQFKGEAGLSEDVQNLRLNLILYWAYAGRKFLTGHVWNDERFARLKNMNYMVITCLRDPVNRWFSAYFYDRYKTSPHAKIEEDLDDFLETERARSMGSTYVRYVGGIRKDGLYESEEAVKKAVDMLDSIDIVSFLDRLDLLKSQVHDKLGFQLKIPYRRRSPADENLRKKIMTSKEYRKTIEDLCRHDLELYEKARLRFS